MACDLHTHSNYSDGTMTPCQIIDEALRLGLYAAALCDHNTVSGVPEFLKSAENKSIHAVAGCEFSADYVGREIHILALFIDEDKLSDVMEFTLDYRTQKENSNRQFVQNLRKHGFMIDYDEIKEREKGYVNRAHIAFELKEKGYASSVEDAFCRIFKLPGVKVTTLSRPQSLDVISFINSIGAVSVLAHPFLNFKTKDSFYSFLKDAKNAGLDGIETRYSLFSKEQEKEADKAAEHFSLLKSGGSDFHADVKPDIKLGSGNGSLIVPNEYYDMLYKRKLEKR